MNENQQELLVVAFSDEIKATYFGRIPSSCWRVERISTNYWLVGVKSDQIETYPYLYSIHFDWKNHIVTIRLEQEVLKSIYLFPHVYYRLIRFFEERKIDLFVRNDNDSLKQQLYKGSCVPLDATGLGSRKIKQLLASVKDALRGGTFYFWKEQNSIQFATPFISNLYYHVQAFILQGQPAEGIIEIDGIRLSRQEDVFAYFQENQSILRHLQEKERDLLDYLRSLHPTIYYDPHSESVTIFQKNIPFSVKLRRSDKNKGTYLYAVRFGTIIKQGEALRGLIQEIKKDMHQYVLEDRLRAVSEGRIQGR